MDDAVPAIRGMEIRHLRTIAAVARHGSFTKAGEELHLAQSAISQQIRRLEGELGIQVFTRSSRSVELTAEGRLVLDYAHRVLHEVEGLQNELEELSGLLRGELKLGGMYPTGLYDLADVIADFHERHPGVAIHMVERTQDELLDAAAHRRAGRGLHRRRPRRPRRGLRRVAWSSRRSSSWRCRSTTR